MAVAYRCGLIYSFFPSFSKAAAMCDFSELKPKDLQRFFKLDSYEKARRLAVLIRDTYQAQMLTVLLLSKYLGISTTEVLLGLK